MNDFLDLDQTLDCGQAFRWTKVDGIWQGIASGQKLSVKQDNIEPIKENPFWSHYFDLDTDYLTIKNKLIRISPIMELAINFSPGIRILNQDPWEMVISFILSQYNNISRIKSMVNNLCQITNPTTLNFPTPNQLLALNPEKLNSLKFGFRDKYVLDGARKINEGRVDLEYIKTLSIEEAEKELEKIVGVGKKVAACILLFGFHRFDSFPVDIWIKRAMDKWFDGQTGEKVFGPYAGIAQQYLFNFIRNGLNT